MKLAAVLAATIAGAPVFVTASAQGRPVPPAEPAIRAALAQSAAAWNAADLKGHIAAYADSATMMGGRGPMTGRDVIGASLERGFWKEGKPAQQLAFDEIVVRPLLPRHALVTGKCILTGGGQPERTCRFSLVWEFDGTAWRIIHDHSS